MRALTPREAIPALIVVLFLIAVVGLVFELLIAAASKKAVDPAAAAVLGAIFTACVPAMLALYLRDSSKPPPDEPDEDMKAARTLLREYLDSIDQMVGWLRWG